MLGYINNVLLILLLLNFPVSLLVDQSVPLGFLAFCFLLKESEFVRSFFVFGDLLVHGFAGSDSLTEGVNIRNGSVT